MLHDIDVVGVAVVAGFGNNGRWEGETVLLTTSVKSLKIRLLKKV